MYGNMKTKAKHPKTTIRFDEEELLKKAIAAYWQREKREGVGVSYDAPSERLSRVQGKRVILRNSYQPLAVFNIVIRSGQQSLRWVELTAKQRAYYQRY